MRIVCISDTHEKHRNISVPDGDILIHAGDFTGRGSLDAIRDFNEWLRKLPHRHKIFTPGNHELSFERTPDLALPLITNAHCLIHQSIVLDGLKFFGSPWTPAFGNWAYNSKTSNRLKLIWSEIPDNTDILITHGPPKFILDDICTFEGGIRHVGCSELRSRVEQLNLKAHVFGHIHEGYGTKMINSTTFVNASICTASYRPHNKPIIIEV